ncbi:MFS transporter [Leekyejoonella antrihumi]|uniref:MFS transporter n=1 Tax=Leekyejoonella antrihumi TaxID=1660198 RepID=UPI001FEA8624|nr:MFS transporter [Leekyejoonella antrihumi]
MSDARRILLLGFLIRIPIFSAGVILTLHVVERLGRSYTAAGLVAAGATLAVAASEPLRGRLLDRFGLRKVVLPSLVMTGLCWSVAPFVGYWKLLLLATVGGLFAAPTFSIIRQGVMAAVSIDDRRTALSLDGVILELSYMVGPLVSVWLTTFVSTAYVLFGVEMLSVVGCALLWWQNPSLRAVDTVRLEGVPTVPRRAWFRPGFVAVCGAAAAGTIVLTGSDVSIVAAVQEWNAVAMMGLVLVFWSLGSVIGGLVYGTLSRAISPFALLLGLAMVTAPMALAGGIVRLGALAFVAGLFCAPTVTSTVDAVSRMVPGVARGEALGWHGSFMTAGSAVGAPLAGVAIDHLGFRGGFLSVAALGVVVAGGGWFAMKLRRRFVAQHALAA